MKKLGLGLGLPCLILFKIILEGFRIYNHYKKNGVYPCKWRDA